MDNGQGNCSQSILKTGEEIKKSCNDAIEEAEGSGDYGKNPSSKEVNNSLPVPWRSLAQDARQGGRRRDFADTTVAANLLVIEAAVSCMMVMVLLVIMVMVVVMVFMLVIVAAVVVVVVVVLVMFLSVVNFSFSSHLTKLLIFLLDVLHYQLLEDGKSECKEGKDQAKEEPNVNHLDVGRLKEVVVLMTSDNFVTFGSEIEMAWKRVYMTSMAVK